jgi:hypothetical protein
MHLSARARLGTAALLVTALGLIAPTAAPSHAAVATAPTVARAAHAPTLKFKINKAGKIKLVHGPKTFRPGRVSFKVSSKSQNATLGFVRFKKGYGFAKFKHDIRATNHGNMKALKRAIRKTSFFGGAGAIGPRGVSGTVVLPKSGRYTVYNFGGNLPKSPVTLHAAGARRTGKGPKTSGTLTALTGIRFGGAASLPHRGNLMFKNKASDSPHFLELDQVQPGTTKQEILQYFQSGSNQPPPFFIAPGIATEVVGPHQAMTMKYNLPAGTYAMLCFFPDPNMGGMPHAFMGMIRIITLK